MKEKKRRSRSRSREDEDEREDERDEKREERGDNFFFWKMSQTRKIRQMNYLTMIRKNSRRTNYSFESSESYTCFQLFS